MFHLISVSLILRNIDFHFFQPTSLRPHVHLCNNAVSDTPQLAAG
ncbi:MAG: hypothetical protein VB125_02640 [Burkholderia sp.]